VTAPWWTGVDALDLDNVAKTYVQNTPKLAPYRKAITGVVALLFGLIGFVATIPADWLPAWAAPAVAFGVWAIREVAGYLVPNAGTPEQQRAAVELIERERARAAKEAVEQTTNTGATSTPVERGGAVGPDGAGY
jgi:hypothetical protein